MAKKKYSPHADWLRLLETNIPILSVSVLDEAFSTGLKVVSSNIRRALRLKYTLWQNARDAQRSHQKAANGANGTVTQDNWLSFVKNELLSWSGSLQPWTDADGPVKFAGASGQYFLVHKKQEGAKGLLYVEFPDSVDYLEKGSVLKSPAEAVAEYCRTSKGAPKVALLTNGDKWTLVFTPEENPDAFATWYSIDWRREPILLNAFYSLFRFMTIFKAANSNELNNSLVGMLTRTIDTQDEMTDTLGSQVQHAIEVLVQSLEKANEDRNGELLKDVDEKTLYEASLTVMMRLVFILCAEERHLLPLGEPLYDDNYAMSTLRAALQTLSDANTEETLERRYDAWLRFLALCRVIYEGVEHPDLHLPALGGSLFDPDLYAFLEGRPEGGEVKPLPIDNRTFLYLLEALQVLENARGAEFVSYGTLDVEQIGHIYEGLLELQIVRSEGVTLRFSKTKQGKEPEQKLENLEVKFANDPEGLVQHLNKAIGVTQKKIQNSIAAELTPQENEDLYAACARSDSLKERVRPFFHLLQKDAWGRPVVYREGAYMVTTGASRRSSGSYYTPRSLTEPVVRHTLEPVVYVGPAEGLAREDWKLKSPEELLDLKICDPAMGSGAFLVQVCRYLSERLVEAWALAEEAGKFVTSSGEVVNKLDQQEPLSEKAEDRFAEARRLVAERCLYGVDLNPLAVELAKLSLWLVTMSKGRPFGFLDHCLGCGDSLLGLTSTDELKALAEGTLPGEEIAQLLHDAVEERRKIRNTCIIDLNDVKEMGRRLCFVKKETAFLDLVANCLILGQVGNFKAKTSKKFDQLKSFLAAHLWDAKQSDSVVIAQLQGMKRQLWKDIKGVDGKCRTFHWALVFPEVFEKGGFNAVIGNPPFIGSPNWKSRLGPQSVPVATFVLGRNPGRVDLSTVFNRRGMDLLARNGAYGLISTVNIAEGDGLKIGLPQIVQHGSIVRAVKSQKWPGTASICVAIICFFKGEWKGKCILNSKPCDRIEPNLTLKEHQKLFDITSPLTMTHGVNNANGDMLLFKKDSDTYQEIIQEKDNLCVEFFSGSMVAHTSLCDVKDCVLNTTTFSLEEIERRWPAAARFLENVRDKRLALIPNNSYGKLKDRWWQFWSPSKDIFVNIENKTYLVFSRFTKFVVPRRINGKMPNDGVLVIVENNESTYPLILSTFFRLWAEKFQGAKRGEDQTTNRLSLGQLRRFPSPKYDVVLGLPNCQNFDKFLESKCGVTAGMNDVCDRGCFDPDVLEAREILQKVDIAVAKAYGWEDLDMTLAIRETERGDRFTVSEETEKEILKRLVALNHTYHEEDLAKGIVK